MVAASGGFRNTEVGARSGESRSWRCRTVGPGDQGLPRRFDERIVEANDDAIAKAA